MEIGGIGNQYIINDSFIPFETGFKGKNDGIDFARRLEAAFNKNEENIPPVSGKTEIDKDSKLFEMCRELETFLLKTLIGSMRNTVQKSGLMDTGFAGKMYEDMLYDEYAKSFAKNAGFGFAEMAYMELDRKSKISISA